MILSRVGASHRKRSETHLAYPFSKKMFLDDEFGAVTVDWVVLTAAVVGLGISALVSIGGGVMAHAGKTESSLAHMAFHLEHGWSIHP